MQVNPQEHHEHVEHLDADAVCEACDTVNPEGTLLCKTCGNNLRDQRARRLKAGGPAAQVAPTFRVANVARGVFILFGICVVLWTAINVSTIQAWLLGGVQKVEATSEGAVDPKTFYAGPVAARYDELASTLAQQPLTMEEAGMLPPGIPLQSLDGRFVLKRSTESVSAPIGAALVKVEGDTAYFVARMAGGTEIRGSAKKTSDTMFQAYSVAIRDTDGSLIEGLGYAQLQPTGEVNCTGLFGEFQTQVNGFAIPVSAPVAGAAEASAPAPSSESATAPAGDANSSQ